jgi:hypothetical protein
MCELAAVVVVSTFEARSLLNDRWLRYRATIFRVGLVNIPYEVMGRGLVGRSLRLMVTITSSSNVYKS